MHSLPRFCAPASVHPPAFECLPAPASCLQALLRNPELLRTMMQANPAVRQMMEANPEVLSNACCLRL